MSTEPRELSEVIRVFKTRSPKLLPCGCESHAELDAAWRLAFEVADMESSGGEVLAAVAADIWQRYAEFFALTAPDDCVAYARKAVREHCAGISSDENPLS